MSSCIRASGASSSACLLYTSYVGEPLIYVNSLDCMAVAINQGSFAKAYNIGTGNKWQITMRKAPKIIYED